MESQSANGFDINYIRNWYMIQLQIYSTSEKIIFHPNRENIDRKDSLSIPLLEETDVSFEM